MCSDKLTAKGKIKIKLIKQNSLNLNYISYCLILCSYLGQAEFLGGETAQSLRTTKHSQVVLRGLIAVDRNSGSPGSLLPAGGP